MQAVGGLLRVGIASKSFVLSPHETSRGSVVFDTIRKLDYETVKFATLLGTLLAHVDTTGLRITEPDLLLILLRSLPEPVKKDCLQHSPGGTNEAYFVVLHFIEKKNKGCLWILDNPCHPTDFFFQHRAAGGRYIR